ncbi:glutamate N-acetyltransferase [Clostridium cavendishii DSM 21758]|uniref:Arginine biosynthesis bifunctional protein ArgJ n=1 Tax=Clostridium cavendishii DSM 21758 TaxID=1121302 RepID=A0A1M6EP62_9CLOT|nr:bifunctional glutamate N-acetyltransferase/amino-acid acetyltransferase ArgJ [Clostridium cavendishii]SHI87277.1 glutamate N-acetyltransferase [Clostridium cavendishii DSM 21758]
MRILKGGIVAPDGFYASGVHCGLKKKKLDLALIYSEVKCNASAMFTKNIVKGNPIIVCKEALIDGKAQAIIINSGNANTCTGEDGLIKAHYMTELVAKAMELDKVDVLVASTGVIGVPLDVSLIEDSIETLKEGLSRTGNINAREAIMTTDLIHKEVAVSINIFGKEVKIGAMAKGSGMIEPNMATMLAFITTDINIENSLLNSALNIAVNKSFNLISVDGDSSTNDSVFIMANGLAKNEIIDSENDYYFEFVDALTYVCVELSKLIASDGEGATKLIECRVLGCKNELEGINIAKAVIKSSLVKTAIFGSDANWGRILCAMGYSGIEFIENKVKLAFESSRGYIEVFKEGIPIEFDETKAKEILKDDDISIIIDLNMGNEKAVAWGCDLSYEYIRINGDYRS